MDWINQNKFKLWLIGILLVLNVLTISIIWIQMIKPTELQRKENEPRPLESVDLIQRTLSLTDDQTRQLGQLQKSRVEKMKEDNDHLDEMKMQLAADLFDNHTDTSFLQVKANEIGAMEASITTRRFMYFHDLLALCSPEQKEKLKPIVLEVMGKKARKTDKSSNNEHKQLSENHPNEKELSSTHDDLRGTHGHQKSEPPSFDEKLAKYAERLNLTSDQKNKIGMILQSSRQKGEELRMQSRPDRNDIESQKERIRNDEDQSILKILDSNQKTEFQKMMLQRQK
jgi:hypothetical protein